LVALAQLELRKGDRPAATRLLDDALAIEPRHTAANRARALMWWEQKQPEKAVPLLQVVLETAPSEIAAAGMLGQYFLDQGRPADACRPLEQAHTVDPKNENISELLGLAWLRVGNEHARARGFKPAITAYDRALAVRPNLAEAYVNKAQVCLHLGEAGGAENALRELARVQPAHPKLPELRAALARLPATSR
jgi:tetratricopeptide (TPR) repeat protein